MNKDVPSYDQRSRWSTTMQMATVHTTPLTQADLSSNASNYQHPSASVPTHIFDDIFRMSTPLGSWNDDEILAKALYDSDQDGSTSRQAIEKLHGVNRHAAFMWKDYYLDHRSRIKLLVDKLRPSQNNASLAKPAPDHLSATVRGRNGKSQPRIQPIVTPNLPKSNISSGRSTINSLTAYLPIEDSSSKAHIQIPDTPSRSPSPPVISSRERNKYTQQDSEYMLKFISWERSRSPNVSKTELSRKLAQKAPHHTFSSWFAHMRNLNLSSVNKVVEDISSSDSFEIKSDRSLDMNYQSESDACSAIDDPDENSTDDELNMGMPGEKYTTADRRLLAKYITTVEDWKNKDNSERFAKFHQRFPHRAQTSWSRYYQRNAKELDKLAEKYKQRGKERHSIPEVAQSDDSWASSSSAGTDSLPSALKRKFRVGEFAASNHAFAQKRFKSVLYSDDSA